MKFPEHLTIGIEVALFLYGIVAVVITKDPGWLIVAGIGMGIVAFMYAICKDVAK